MRLVLLPYIEAERDSNGHSTVNRWMCGELCYRDIFFRVAATQAQGVLRKYLMFALIRISFIYLG